MSLVRICVSIIIGIQLLGFGIARTRQTDKLTDLLYGGTFVILAIYLLWQQAGWTDYQLLLAGAVILWGLRLAIYLFIRIMHMRADRRFDEMRQVWRKFGGFWLLQAVSIVIISAPLLAVFMIDSGGVNTSMLYMGVGVFGIGLLIETIADRQKFHYKRMHPDHRTDIGLWSLARHPNYFGEILVRWGIYMMGMTVFTGWYIVTIISPLYIMLLLLYVSGIPLLEKQHDKKYGADPTYIEYKKRTRVLIPFKKI